MAKSLVCKDCNTLLRSIKEAQDHGDATGHANFEETTIAVCSCGAFDTNMPLFCTRISLHVHPAFKSLRIHPETCEAWRLATASGELGVTITRVQSTLRVGTVVLAFPSCPPAALPVVLLSRPCWFLSII